MRKITAKIIREMAALRLLPLVFMVLAATNESEAQNDRHYNTIQYGLRGMIMNGAMVAGVHDNSAIYYNPAALSISGNEGLDLSLFAISMEFIKRKNAFDDGTAPRKNSLSFIPGLITFNTRPFRNKNISLSAGGFTRNSFNIAIDDQYMEQNPGSLRLNSFRMEHIGREYWLAGAISYKFSKNIAIGMSQYFSIRSTRYSHELSYQVFDPDEAGLLLFEDRESLHFRQNHSFGFINKLGFTWFNDFAKLGFTLTTPMYVRIVKNTDVLYNVSTYENGVAKAKNYSFNEKGQSKTPFIARMGVEFKGPKFLIAASMEYFRKVPEYDLIRSDEESQLSIVNGPDPLVLKDSRKQIFNINLGWEFSINERFDYLGGLRTNFNYNDQPSDYIEPRIHQSYFDIYHLTTGLKVNVKRSNFTIGIDYGFSFNDNLPVMADLTAGSVASFDDAVSSVVYNNITFLFTYSFILDRFSDLLGNSTD
jgi:hypothetical protein